jgi:hypothetical protein
MSATIINCTLTGKGTSYRITMQDQQGEPEWLADFRRSGDAYEYARTIAVRFPDTVKITITERRK